jgi:hypothetical protein
MPHDGGAASSSHQAQQPDEDTDAQPQIHEEPAPAFGDLSVSWAHVFGNRPFVEMTSDRGFRKVDAYEEVMRRNSFLRSS